MNFKNHVITGTLVASMLFGITRIEAQEVPREHLLMDFGWKFSMGCFGNFEKDYMHGTRYFTYLAKTGYGDGPAAPDFDDRAWRKLNVPHDWAIELPFTYNGSHSHGYIALGWKFPENSVGWYRKKFSIPETDLGKRISVQFDGIYRNAAVWVNGFYVGHEPSGYAEAIYDITDYLNYGKDNVISVRVDATMEEGWFYEGAGIYRHIWLNKTAQVHIADNGIFVNTNINGSTAAINIGTTVSNQLTEKKSISIEHQILDGSGQVIARQNSGTETLNAGQTRELVTSVTLNNPKLWSLENPYLHTLITQVYCDGKLTDRKTTTFGIRTVRFDANKGFFLNGKHVIIKGTNNHQDHAGIGVALPDGMQDYRIMRLKEMGSNAYRCSHNPPTPELLEACDRLGMMVLAENRLMGSNQEHFDLLKRMIVRDRNHPSVIIWSLGNEEWAIEGNITGARIAASMQAFAHSIDSTRMCTVAASGGWDYGVSTVTDVMGYNYIKQGDIDGHHKLFPNQPAVGTEESTTSGTRGIYKNDKSNGHMAATDRTGEGPSIEYGWKYYMERPFLSGLFYWTGFDYRGEPNPLGWPAVSSQFGIIDICGFPKDPFYYLQTVWKEQPMVHLAPHWNWKTTDSVSVWAYSNCDAVELFLNKKSLGKKSIPKYSHAEWNVKYQPGTLQAKGFSGNTEVASDKIETTGEAAGLVLMPQKMEVAANGEDVSVINIKVTDAKGRVVPDACNEITMEISGPGKLLGVGNGDPGSHEPDKFLDKFEIVSIRNLKESVIDGFQNRPEMKPDFDDSNWKQAFNTDRNSDWRIYKDSLIAIRGEFELPVFTADSKITFFSKSIAAEMNIYINGELIAAKVYPENSNQEFVLDPRILKPGKNTYAITALKFRKRYQWDEHNTDPGVFQVITPQKEWKRKAFNGYMQVIVQSLKEPGTITLKANSEGLKSNVVTINSKSASLRPSVRE